MPSVGTRSYTVDCNYIHSDVQVASLASLVHLLREQSSAGKPSAVVHVPACPNCCSLNYVSGSTTACVHFGCSSSIVSTSAAPCTPWWCPLWLPLPACSPSCSGRFKPMPNVLKHSSQKYQGYASLLQSRPTNIPLPSHAYTHRQ